MSRLRSKGFLITWVSVTLIFAPLLPAVVSPRDAGEDPNSNGFDQSVGVEVVQRLSIERLVGILTDKNWLTGGDAAIALGWFGDQCVGDPLTVVKCNQVAGFRPAAVRSLGVFRDRQAVAAQVTAAGYTEMDVRRDAAVALAIIGDLQAQNALFVTSDSPSYDLRVAAASAVKQPVPITADKRQNKDIAHPDSGVRLRVAEAPRDSNLSGEKSGAEYDLSIREAQKRLKALGYSPGPIDGIWGRKTKSAVELFQGHNGLPVTGRLDADTRHRLKAISTQAPLDADPSGTDSEDAEHVAEIASWEKQKETERLVAALQDEDRRVRIAALGALRQIDDPQLFDHFVAALHDKDAYVRLLSARVLGEMADPRAVKPLIGALGDQRDSVRGAVAEALGSMGEPAIKPLVAALRHKEWSVRESAVKALGKIGDPRAIVALFSALTDKSLPVRQAAASALQLGRAGDLKLVEALLVAHNAEDAMVRSAAAAALRKVYDAEGVAPIIDVAPDLRAVVTSILPVVNDHTFFTQAADYGKIIISLTRNNSFYIFVLSMFVITMVGGGSVFFLFSNLASDGVRILFGTLLFFLLGPFLVLFTSVEIVAIILLFLPVSVPVFLVGRQNSVRPSLAGKLAFTFLFVILPAGCFVLSVTLAAAVGWYSTEFIFPAAVIFPVVPALLYYVAVVLILTALAILVFANPIFNARWLLTRLAMRRFVCPNCLLRRFKLGDGLPWFVRWSGRFLAEEIPQVHSSFKDYCVCGVCGTEGDLRPSEVIGFIGSGMLSHLAGDKLFLSLWDDSAKKAQNADIDCLEIHAVPGMNYDSVVSAVLMELKNDVSRPAKFLRRIPVRLRNNPPLSTGTRTLLENECRKVSSAGERHEGGRRAAQEQ